MFFDSVFAVLIFFEHSLGLYLAPLFQSFQHALICYKVNKHDHTCVNLSVCLFVSFNLCNLCKPTILQKILDFCHNGSSSLKLYSTRTIVSVSEVSIVANTFKGSSSVCTSSIHVTIMAVIFAFINICIGSESESNKLSKGRVCL